MKVLSDEQLDYMKCQELADRPGTYIVRDGKAFIYFSDVKLELSEIDPEDIDNEVSKLIGYRPRDGRDERWDGYSRLEIIDDRLYVFVFIKNTLKKRGRKVVALTAGYVVKEQEVVDGH